MTTSPSIGASTAPSLPHGGPSATAGIIPDAQSVQDKGRANSQDDITISTDQVELLWRAKQDRTDWNDTEHLRIQREVAALALSSAPTISGREVVLRQMESLRHGLNEQAVALVTRKAALALEVTPVSLTRPTREQTLRRVF